MNSQSANVINLLSYIEEVEKLRRKPVYSVPNDYFAVFQAELVGMPELQVNLLDEAEEVWLRVPRMQEIPAPAAPAVLAPWLTVSKALDRPPVLNSSRPVMEGRTKVGTLELADHPEIPPIFDWYLTMMWTPWQEAEKVRRRTIQLYNKLFLLYQTLSTDGAENPIELVWGVGMASWKRDSSSTKVEHPLLTLPCELRLNEKTFALEISPRQADAKLELDCYSDMDVGGVVALEALWKEAQSKLATATNPFAHDTFEGILKPAVANLDSTGRYERRTSDVTLPTASETLVVTSTWVVFARKRSADVFVEDVRRLKAKLEAGAEVPAVIKEFVTEGDSVVRTQAEVPFRGLSTSSSAAGAQELYFPLPYNDEQVAIASKLERNAGVVVQGPPGTGKTHTIANIICHFLAQGKRVLVTSKGDTALSVLQEKLPEKIRALSVGLFSDEQDGMRQFEQSISNIASEVASLQPGQLQQNIDAFEVQLNELHARISAVDHDISQAAAQNMQRYQFQGKEVTPEELAKLVMAQIEDHQWFEDELPETADSKAPIAEDDIARLRKSRTAAKDDLAYVGVPLPALSAFPAWEALRDLHRDIVRSKNIDEEVQSGDVYALKDSSFETFKGASELSATLKKYMADLALVKANPLGARLLPRVRDMQADDVLITTLVDLKRRFGKLDDYRKQVIAKAIEVPPDAEKSEDFVDALERLLEGKSPFALPFGRGDARKMIANVSVAGSKPGDVDAWKDVKGVLAWRTAAGKEIARFSAIAVEFGLEPLSRQELFASVRSGAEQLGIVETVHQVVFGTERGLYSAVEKIFGDKVASGIDENTEAGLLLVVESLSAHLDKGRLGYAMARVGEYANLVDAAHGKLHAELKHFLQERLGSADEAEGALRTSWLALLDELKRLNGLKEHLDFIELASEAVTVSGAPMWAKKLRTVPPTSDFDPLLPANWADAWAWRVAFGLLERIDAHNKLRTLFNERRELTTKLARTYQELVATRTWLGVYNNSPPNIRQALQAYLTSIQSMGGGTGVRALRHRRNARDAMSRAYLAVPCWILPQWRVSETLPAELGLFDLVIIDEASQSDIWALPALMRGKKLLVVGDHKQVSPSVVGMLEQKIVEIERRFLGAQPHGKQMTPDMSIYDLARVVFAGNSVMLREHFRCVSAIIEYSNREFYENEIVPLRIPKATERLDPPLVDVFVKGGYRKKDSNPGEAQAIVDEIKAILADEAMADRSIGVVTLLGTDQAKLIHEMIGKHILPEDIVARKITVGPPPVFQGRERDIMMVSMVLQRGDRTAANSLGQQQRFNVALSRARDRTYLFRSVDDNAFGGDTLTGKLMQHFRQPFKQDQKRVSAARDLCESGFEFEMFDALTKRGYRVRPQVPCGGHRIDFVVEGNEGRRLAVECDGDRYHGPGQWGADMVRQRVLERAGWVFWRCFASSFVRNREGVLADLFATLAQLGIEPIGDEPESNSAWVVAKTVDPLGTDVQQDLQQEPT